MGLLKMFKAERKLNRTERRFKDSNEMVLKIIEVISKHTVWDEERLFAIFERVKSFDKLFCIINMAQRFHCDLESAEYYITSWMGGELK